jgi:hypothetical protein
VDAAGGLWIALSGAGQVAQIDPETGETKMVVLLPVASPTSLTFGGDELDTLYITSRGPDGGGLYAVQMPFGVRGIAERERSHVDTLVSVRRKRVSSDPSELVVDGQSNSREL